MWPLFSPCAVAKEEWIAQFPVTREECTRGQWEGRTPDACKQRAERVLAECSRYVRLVAALCETQLDDVYVRGSATFKQLLDAEEATQFPFLHAVQLAIDHDRLQLFLDVSFTKFWPKDSPPGDGPAGSPGAAVSHSTIENTVAPVAVAPVAQSGSTGKASADDGNGNVSFGAAGIKGGSSPHALHPTATGNRAADPAHRMSSRTTVAPPGALCPSPAPTGGESEVASVNWKKVQGYAIVRQLAELDERQKRDLDGRIHSLLMRWI